MRPTALILCGLPFAGKSTLAEALIADGYLIVSIDGINEERGLGKNGAKISAYAWEETHKIALERFRDHLQTGKNVVWDDTNYAAFIRDPIFEAAMEAGGEPVVVFVDAPVEVVRSRAGQTTKHSRPSSVQDIERVIKNFERPACGVRIDGTVASEHAIQTLKQILRRDAAIST